MDKLKMHSPDITQQNINKLLELFPNCKTEKQDDNGELCTGVDFDLLKQELSKNIVEGQQERYQLNWPGKKEALLIANAPIAKTLRPCREESIDFDTTENLFIEGDNLEALKLLQETYLGKVKMIYIDPPYNTGNDFIYNDDFSESSEEYLLDSEQIDEKGNRLIANTESNGRFHSDWLSMMYSRLRLAKNLLAENGVIFISIDDTEQANLKRLCDEIFGEDNLIGTFLWISKKGGGSDNAKVVTDQEYVIAYGRDVNAPNLLSKIIIEAEPLNLEDENGRYRIGRELNKWGANSRREDRPTMYFSIHGPDGCDVYPIRNDGTEGCWRWGKPKMLEALAVGNIEFKAREDGTFIAYEKIRTDDPREKPHRTFIQECGTTADGSKLIKHLFDDKKVFDFPKPMGLIKTLIEIGTSRGEECFILDFFCGSATTAHAVMQLNAEDNGQRKIIMVQLPEICDETSEAYKAGYQTIAEISKERIRRAGTKIKGENPGAKDLDTGFRVLKIDFSNMNDVNYRPDAVAKGDLFNQVEHIKVDRSSEDLLFQVMLDWGVGLSLPIRKEIIEGKEVYFVNDDDLAACFDKDIDESLIKALAAKQPLRVVFRDDGFVSDSVKINVEQIFKQLAPATDIKAI